MNELNEEVLIALFIVVVLPICFILTLKLKQFKSMILHNI